MPTIPDVIYLQWYAEDGEYAEDVTWCVDRIHKTDIEYRLIPRATDAADDSFDEADYDE